MSSSSLDSIALEEHYCDKELWRKSLRFHYSGQLVLDEKLSMGVHYNSIPQGELAMVEESCRDTILKEVAADDETIFEKRTSKQTIERQSAQHHAFKKISLKTLAQLLFDALGERRRGEFRAYPSAGQLYPIETLVWINGENIEESIDSGIYHYRPQNNSLSKMMTFAGSFDFDRVIPGGLALPGKPIFGLIYMVNIKRALMKYRIRGYRNAFIEIGIMTQNIDRVASGNDFTTRCWSSFDDRKLSLLTGLHPNLFLPGMIQWVGAEDE